MTRKRDRTNAPSRDPDPGAVRRERRPGSRILLAVALAGGVLGALFAGARISDTLCDLLGIASNPVRLGIKVAIIVIALPAGFYLVERCFLPRGDRDGGTGAGAQGGDRR